MARVAKLKVYRTAIGFHDAYVAAPSQQAALKAWGTDKNLFARGAAELVEDAALAAEPLAAPGTVIKRPRGTTAEHIASLPPDRPKTAPSPAAEAKPARQRRPVPKPKPRPSRDALDSAEAAITAAEQQYREEERALAEQEAALAIKRKAMQKRHDEAVRQLEHDRAKRQRAYDDAMRTWRA